MTSTLASYAKELSTVVERFKGRLGCVRWTLTSTLAYKKLSTVVERFKSRLCCKRWTLTSTLTDNIKE